MGGWGRGRGGRIVEEEMGKHRGMFPTPYGKSIVFLMVFSSALMHHVVRVSGYFFV